jgi:hypothetical protein
VSMTEIRCRNDAASSLRRVGILGVIIEAPAILKRAGGGLSSGFKLLHRSKLMAAIDKTSRSRKSYDVRDVS